jgi:hypothetical protein
LLRHSQTVLPLPGCVASDTSHRPLISQALATIAGVLR